MPLRWPFNDRLQVVHSHAKERFVKACVQHHWARHRMDAIAQLQTIQSIWYNLKQTYLILSR